MSLADEVTVLDPADDRSRCRSGKSPPDRDHMGALTIRFRNWIRENGELCKETVREGYHR